jgi:hypothetical protein
MARLWMTEKFIGHWDGYSGYAPGHVLPNNYYLYSDPSGKFQMLPWGTDQTWVEPTGFATSGGHLFNLCLEAGSGCRPLYEAAGKELLSTLSVAGLDKAARCAAAAVDPWRRYEDQISETAKKPGYTLAETTAVQAETRDFIADRPTELAAFLGADAPPKSGDSSPCPPLRPVGGFPPPADPPAPPSLPVAPDSGPALSGDPLTTVTTAGPAPAVTLGRRTTTRGAVKLRLHVSHPGAIRVRGSYGIGAGRRATACRGSATATAAGPLEVGCALTAGFRNRLLDRAIALRIEITLTTSTGTTGSSLKLRLPRR